MTETELQAVTATRAAVWNPFKAELKPYSQWWRSPLSLLPCVSDQADLLHEHKAFCLNIFHQGLSQAWVQTSMKWNSWPSGCWQISANNNNYHSTIQLKKTNLPVAHVTSSWQQRAQASHLMSSQIGKGTAGKAIAECSSLERTMRNSTVTKLICK